MEPLKQNAQSKFPWLSSEGSAQCAFFEMIFCNRILFSISVVIIFSTFCCGRINGAEIRVAVASNFISPMKKLAELYSKEFSHKLLISYGSSGKFYAQIKNGAPFDVFLSADANYTQKLILEQLAIKESEFTYATGKLVLWFPDYSKSTVPSEILKNMTFKRIALANPKLAPYGAAAKEVLIKMKLWELLKERAIYGENINQTYLFIASRNAEVGFVAYSQIKNDANFSKNSFWLIPQSFYSPLKQGAVLLKSGDNNLNAKHFLSFLKSEKVKNILHHYGFEN